ncbi:MAG: sugar transferase, partial [Flavobacteriaceae bacterium]
KFLKEAGDTDVIVADYNLPGNNGLYLFKHLKEEWNGRNYAFIILQDSFNSSIMRQCMALGITDYFVKNATSSNHIIERIQKVYELKASIKDQVVISRKSKLKLPLSKRLFDLAFASSVLLVTSPFLLLIMLAIRLESKGRVYYISKRVGRKTFDFYKLRSMRQGADKMLNKLSEKKNQYNARPKAELDLNEPCPACSLLADGMSCSPLIFVNNHKICEKWHTEQRKKISDQTSTFIKIQNDPRITRIGKFIRNTSIDELPQLINVIKGDMSIVGNRPLPVYEAELLTEDLKSKRFLAPAGITGLWQVELRGKGVEMSEDERIALDNSYADEFIENRYSFWNDMKLILRTVPALLQKNNV